MQVHGGNVVITCHQRKTLEPAAEEGNVDSGAERCGQAGATQQGPTTTNTTAHGKLAAAAAAGANNGPQTQQGKHNACTYSLTSITF